TRLQGFDRPQGGDHERRIEAAREPDECRADDQGRGQAPLAEVSERYRRAQEAAVGRQQHLGERQRDRERGERREQSLAEKLRHQLPPAGPLELAQADLACAQLRPHRGEVHELQPATSTIRSAIADRPYTTVQLPAGVIPPYRSLVR